LFRSAASARKSRRRGLARVGSRFAFVTITSAVRQTFAKLTPQHVRARPEDSPLSAPLHEFGSEIWVGEGPIIPFYFGFSYPTRMVIVRLSDGDLFVWSPIPLSLPMRREVDKLGPVRHLVAPNLLHHLFLAEWKSAYPEARLYAAPGLRGRRGDLTFDFDLVDTPNPRWAADLDQVLMRGSVAMTEVVFFHYRSRTVIFADLIQNLANGWFKGWRRLSRASPASSPRTPARLGTGEPASSIVARRVRRWSAFSVGRSNER
jgi:hypothetical protein